MQRKEGRESIKGWEEWKEIKRLKKLVLEFAGMWLDSASY